MSCTYMYQCEISLSFHVHIQVHLFPTSPSLLMSGITNRGYGSGYKHTHNRVSTDTLDQHPWLTSWLILKQHPDWYSVNTQSTLDQEPVDSQPSINQLLHIDQKLVHSWPTVEQDVDQVSTRLSMECQLSTDQVSIKSQSHNLYDHMIQGYYMAA